MKLKSPISRVQKEISPRVIRFSKKPVADSRSVENVVIDVAADESVVSLEILPFVPGKLIKSRASPRR